MIYPKTFAEYIIGKRLICNGAGNILRVVLQSEVTLSYICDIFQENNMAHGVIPQKQLLDMILKFRNDEYNNMIFSDILKYYPEELF